MNRKQKRDAKNERHRIREKRRQQRWVRKRFPYACELMGVEFMVDALQGCRRA